MICIWCKKDFPKLSLEHGIPEALACPPELELRNVACPKCNNDLSRVDKALIKSFEMITVMYGVPRKKGRPPVIASWRPIRSEHRADGPHVYINGGPGVVSAMGKPLHPANKSTGVSNIWASPETGKLGFSWEMGNDPRFIPALFKIGLNVVAKVYGPETAASDTYDHIRAFVLLEPAAPDLTAALHTDVAHSPLTSATFLTKPSRFYPMCQITILGVTFLIDLDPDQKSLTDIRGAATLMGDPMYVFPKSR
jgi:hypothetical protein